MGATGNTKLVKQNFAARINRGEWSFVVLMFLYFFAVITTFWILKPIKKAMFIDYYNVGGHTFDLFGWDLSGPQAEMIAKIGNMVVVFFAVLVFTWLARTLRRQQLTYVFAAFCFVMFLMYRATLPNAGEATVWSFYIFGDLYNSLMVATFFAFLNDSVSPLDARRLYGPIMLGGVAQEAPSSDVSLPSLQHAPAKEFPLPIREDLVLLYPSMTEFSTDQVMAFGCRPAN